MCKLSYDYTPVTFRFHCQVWKNEKVKKHCKCSVELFSLPTLDCSFRNLNSHESRAFERIYVYTANVAWTRFNLVGCWVWLVVLLLALLQHWVWVHTPAGRMVLHKVDEANATKATYMMRLGESTGTSIHIRTALHLLAPVVTSVTARGPFGPTECVTL